MKNLFLLILTIGLFSMTACGPSAEEQAKKEAEAKAAVDAMFEEVQSTTTDSAKATETALIEHACNDKCKPGACNIIHGEKGHTCGAECKK